MNGFGGVVVEVEDGLNGSTISAGTDDLGGGAPAENAPDGVDDDRLAGTGLAGEDRQIGRAHV